MANALGANVQNVFLALAIPWTIQVEDVNMVGWLVGWLVGWGMLGYVGVCWLITPSLVVSLWLCGWIVPG